MARTSRKQRFAMFAVTAALVTGGALVPTSAFAAQAAPHAAEAHAKSGHGDTAGKHERGGKDRSKSKSKSKGRKNSKPRDVENMPGCKFYQGKVYCEHKPDTPKPAPAPHPAPAPAPAPAPDPDVVAKDNPDRVPAPDAGGFGIELKP